jgi:3-hydroxybutyryl-CoA dehydratase
MRYEELTVGRTAERTNAVTDDVIRRYAEVTGDHNPIHLDAAYAETTMFKGRIAHGMLSAGFISAVIGMELPGPGALYIGQTLTFKRPVKLDDVITTRVEVIAREEPKRRATLKTTCTNQDGKVVIEGEATIQLMEDTG